MLQFVRNLPRAFRVAKLWGAAIGRSSSGECREALICLQEIGTVYGGELGSLRVPYYVNLLASNLLRNLGEHSRSISVALVAIEQVVADKGLSEFEKIYLRYYAAQGIFYSVRSQGDGWDSLRRVHVDFSDVNVDKVSKKTLQEFPIIDPNTGRKVRRSR